jgi:hypothetical protein
VFSGGRNFSQKAQKRPEKHKVGRKIFGRIFSEFQKKWQKREFSKDISYLTVHTDKHSETKTKIISF